MKQTAGKIVITGNSGNISIGSENVTQTININELRQTFEKLEKLINEKLADTQKQDALDELETAKELAKVQPPKWNLVKKALSHLGTVPAICEGVKSVIDFVSQFQ